MRDPFDKALDDIGDEHLDEPGMQDGSADKEDRWEEECDDF